MFSGIKSIIFGYSEPAAPEIASTDNNDGPAANKDDLGVVRATESSDANDSSDIADMDESWYVIPPPCFTGANKFNHDETVKPKAKEADRENALIEHPSMYIASTSNRDSLIELKQERPTSASRKQTIESCNLAPKLQKATTGSKKATKQLINAPDQPLSANLVSERKTVSISVPSNEKKTTTKAWDKKLSWIQDKEDALIEHPSIYIASTSNRDLIEQKPEKPAGSTNRKQATELSLAKAKVATTSKRVNNKQVATVTEKPLSPNLNKRKTVHISVPSNEKKNTKLWNKKLNWIYDDDEDVLIEYPSMYSANTANRDLIENKQNEPNSASEKSSEVVLVERQKAIAPKQKVNKQVTNEQSGSSDRNKRKSAPVSAQPKEKKNTKAWENKFIVTNWDDEEQDDINDFDNLFDSDDLVQSPPKAKKSKAKKQQQQLKKRPIEVESSDFENMSASFESSSFSIPPSPTPALVEDEQPDETAASELIGGCAPAIGESLKEQAKALDGRQNKSAQRERKAPIPVRPIEPERQPSWLLKKVRSRRRPLTTVFPNNTCRVSPVERYDRPMVALRKVKTSNEAPSRSAASKGSPAASPSSSARSSPTIIDRIGTSLAVNLNNLTSGFPAAPMPAMQQARAAMEEAEKLNQSVVRKASVEFNQTARRRLSKSYLDRQNNCVKLANTHRRADRRLKMHITPNGCSVNRKVQTSFH